MIVKTTINAEIIFINEDYFHIQVYWVGPILGSMLASAFYLALHKVDVDQVHAEREDKMAIQMTEKTQL